MITGEVQYSSESQTIRHSNGHLSDTFWVRLSNGPAIKWSGPDIGQAFEWLKNSIKLDGFIIKKSHKRYFIHAKTVQSYRAGLFCPILQYLSGFQMVKTKWPLPFESRTGLFSSASQDRFVMNKIFFMTLFFIKRFRLATIRNPDFCFRVSNGLAIEWSGLAQD